MFDLYDEPLFRPPSEANSAIIQATLGCSWNACAFCTMYESKRFRPQSEARVVEQLRFLASQVPHVRKAFLADGNAFVLSYDKLVRLVELVRQHLPAVHRISAYALPADIRTKTPAQLRSLREMGLSLLYIGVETGCDELLRAVNKRERAGEMAEGIELAHQAGIQTSIMIINGLGGREFSSRHAMESARLMSRVRPKFLSILALFLPQGLEGYRARFRGEFSPLEPVELLHELHTFVGALDLAGTIFRANHVSNPVGFAGTLPRDQRRLLDEIQQSIDRAQAQGLRVFDPTFGY